MKKYLSKISIFAFLIALISAESGNAGPIHQAVISQNWIEINRIFLDKAAFFKLDQQGNNALTLAVKSQDLVMARFLLNHWFPVDMPNEDGTTPLQSAIENNDAAMLRLLISRRGVLVNTISGRTIWHSIATGKISGPWKDEILAILSEEKFALNRPDSSGWTALHYAVAASDEETVSQLLDLGADFNIKATYGETPLHKAARSYNLRILKRLLDAGAEINAVDNYGNSPLALINKFADINCALYHRVVAYLLEQGANPEILNKGGIRAGDICALDGWGYLASLRQPEDETSQTAILDMPALLEETKDSHQEIENCKGTMTAPGEGCIIKDTSSKNESLSTAESVDTLKLETEAAISCEVVASFDTLQEPLAFTKLEGFYNRRIGEVGGALAPLDTLISDFNQGKISDLGFGSTLFLADGTSSTGIRGMNAEKLSEFKSRYYPQAATKITKTDLKLKHRQEGEAFFSRELDLHSAESWSKAFQGEVFDTIFMQNGLCCCCADKISCAGINKTNLQAFVNQVLEHLAVGGSAIFWSTSSTAKADKIYKKWLDISSDLYFPENVAVVEECDSHTGNFYLAIQKQ